MPATPATSRCAIGHCVLAIPRYRSLAAVAGPITGTSRLSPASACWPRTEPSPSKMRGSDHDRYDDQPEQGIVGEGRFHPPRRNHAGQRRRAHRHIGCWRSEEHTSELQSLMRISYAVFCLKKKKTKTQYYI